MVGRGEKISTKGGKVSVKGAKDESAKGSQGVGKDSKEVREGPRRTLRFSTNTHSIIEPVSFLCSNILSNSSNVYSRPVQSITVFIIIGLYEFHRRLTGLYHSLKSTVIPHIIRG